MIIFRVIKMRRGGEDDKDEKRKRG